jgi:hypothetical protein
MTALETSDLTLLTAVIREKYEHYWHDKHAQAEMKALWGDAVNSNGVFVESEEETLHDRDGHQAAISISTANGVYAFGWEYRTTTQGGGSAPSVWEGLFSTHAAARAAAIECLLAKIPADAAVVDERQDRHLGRMRHALEGLLRQPSLL